MRADDVAARYVNGSYYARHPGWHDEDAAWKAREIAALLRRNDVTPRRVVEVGSGSGGVLAGLQRVLSARCEFRGYEVSAEALAMSRAKENECLRFTDTRSEVECEADVALAIDVVEHIEDCYAFLRWLRGLAPMKIVHVPLELSVVGALRPHAFVRARRNVGHLHVFCRETFEELLDETGYQTVDATVTMPYYDLPAKTLGGRIMSVPRRAVSALSPGLSARFLGGASLLVLAR